MKEFGLTSSVVNATIINCFDADVVAIHVIEIEAMKAILRW